MIGIGFFMRLIDNVCVTVTSVYDIGIVCTDTHQHNLYNPLLYNKRLSVESETQRKFGGFLSGSNI